MLQTVGTFGCFRKNWYVIRAKNSVLYNKFFLD